MTPLRPYQYVGAEFLSNRRVALLADEMRLGKTAQVIVGAWGAGAKRILVICPAIAVYHWQAEFARWWQGKAPSLDVVSYNKATTDAEKYTVGEYDLLVLDESHFLKNPTAKRTVAILGKGGVASKAKRCWAVSGTPAPKHVGELWPMLFAFGRTKLKYHDFLNRYCIVDRMTLRPLGTRKNRVHEVSAMLDGVMIRRKRKQVAPEMPAISFSMLEVPPGADIKAPADMNDAQLLAWLDTHRMQDVDDRVAVAMHKAKTLAIEIEEQITGGTLKQTVVFGWHIEPLKFLTDELRKVNIVVELITGATPQPERQRILERFKTGHLPVVVANILAAGTAIDMSAASHGYMLELDWVPGNNMQAVNRLVRVGKNEPVTIDVVTMPGTIDDAIQRVLIRRVDELNSIL